MENIIFNKDQDSDTSGYKDYSQDLFLTPEPKRLNNHHHSSDSYVKKKKGQK